MHNTNLVNLERKGEILIRKVMLRSNINFRKINYSTIGTGELLTKIMTTSNKFIRLLIFVISILLLRTYIIITDF